MIRFSMCTLHPSDKDPFRISAPFECVFVNKQSTILSMIFSYIWQWTIIFSHDKDPCDQFIKSDVKDAAESSYLPTNETLNCQSY